MANKYDDQIALAIEELKNRKETAIDTELYTSYLIQIHHSFMTYMGRPIIARLPDGLFYDWIEATILYMEKMELKESIQTSGLVSSITEGDEKIDFDNAVAKQATVITTNDIIKLFNTSLNAYRLLR
ncbi:MAG: hypothetical protein ACK5L6_10175 [Anaerorhabdus sp.]|uniref:hypothetical protein n=1 Tax=Anaerorhabdus sp. TaxID=1872524 RepID=UPI003A83D1EC